MDTPALEPSPTTLPPGTTVGAWRITGTRGRGTYGTIYTAVSQERGDTGPVALKLAVYADDPRFEREEELLSRIRHPSVPRLLDSGQWRTPAGRAHPFLVMEWADGVPLYEWAAWRNPTSRQVLALLAQAARGLQATHEVSGVHRDVKGDNILVRPAEGRLFLTDFGSGYYAGAARLTPLPLLTSTPAYRSPQVWQCLRHAGPEARSPLLARPSDDVFALGVTAYRLVTDSYPPSTHPYDEESRCWQPGGGGARPPRQLNPQVDAQLNALILRMLSAQPEERGTARELAEALERGVAHGGPSADTPLFEWETQPSSEWTEEEWAEVEHLGHRPRRRARPSVHEPPPQAPAQRARARSWRPWLAAVLALGLWSGETDSVRTELRPTTEGRQPVSLGDTSLNQAAAATKVLTQKAIVLEVPKQPQPGQLRPDAKGRCPDKQIAINGGCWLKVDLGPEYCLGNVFTYQGGCYMPITASAPVPTSAPSER
jgi:serine/threonine protein kinase